MINLELPKKLKASANQAHQVAAQIFRPISRKYDLAEHEYPVELEKLIILLDEANVPVYTVAGGTAAQAGQLIANEIAKWKKIITAANININ